MNLKKTAIIFALSLIVIAGLAAPKNIRALDQDRKTVKVGWYESSYNSIDENGLRSGYAYEYQLKLSAYNGWTFEYVEGSWPELLHKLQTGEIDLMSDISYTSERAETMFYSTLPMGTEEYYLFTAPNNSAITLFDKSSLKGKKIGVNQDSYQLQLFKQWLENYEIECEVIEVSCTEDESLQMLENNDLDGYVTVDSFMDTSRAAPVYKIGSSDYYFAVNKNRPDLYEELEYAMSKIQDENRFYNNEMYEKYIRRAGANAFLSPQEKEWLKFHRTIKVGYQNNYLAFCAKNKETGELDGVLKEYLEYASDAIYNVHINFKPVCYETAEEALEDILSSNNLDHDSLKLEITESAYTENADQVIQVVGRLRSLGFKVEMDDFGTGYSSLNMLSSMPIDVIKMDREFIRNIDHDQKGQQLVALIIEIAKNLKIPVIAEGVERETQIQILRKMGCDIVQGFYFSRPLPADEFEKRFLVTI